MSKRTPKYWCPHCGSTEDFGEANVLKATAAILSFDKRGEPVYAGESDIDWDSQKLDPGIDEPYECGDCRKSFARPTLVGSKRPS